MKDLIYQHQFLIRSENIDFSGTCTISPYQPKVTLEGIPINPEDQDNYYKNRGPIPSFQNVNENFTSSFCNVLLILNIFLLKF